MMKCCCSSWSVSILHCFSRCAWTFKAADIFEYHMCWIKPYPMLWHLLGLSEHTETQWEHCPYSVKDTTSFLAGPAYKGCWVWIWPHVHGKRSDAIQPRPVLQRDLEETTLDAGLDVAMTDQVQRKRKWGVVFLSSSHQFTYWLWMGVILKHVNVGSLCLYQLMQVSVVFGRALKAQGEKDVLRVRKGCINSSRITLPTLSMAEILWMDPLWGGFCSQKANVVRIQFIST